MCELADKLRTNLPAAAAWPAPVCVAHTRVGGRADILPASAESHRRTIQQTLQTTCGVVGDQMADDLRPTERPPLPDARWCICVNGVLFTSPDQLCVQLWRG